MGNEADGFRGCASDWLVEQRWFAGKGRAFDDLAIVRGHRSWSTAIRAAAPDRRGRLRHGDTVDYYQVLVGLRRELPERLEHAMIGPADDGRMAYDALHDADADQAAARRDRRRRRDRHRLRMRRSRAPTSTTGLDSLVLGGEQSNTCLVYGEDVDPQGVPPAGPGLNPDLEVTTALAGSARTHVAEPLGWIETTLDGVPTSLALLPGTCGWPPTAGQLAATSVRDLYALRPRARHGR